MSFSVGIVGLPNVGKSTLFKALTKRQVDIADYPFTTISPNVGQVAVPDRRLKEVAKVIKPKKVTPTIIEFVDIAGLVKGAHQGEGLGNQFLAQIRNCDAIVQVIRAFGENPQPQQEIEIVKLELEMKDLESKEKENLLSKKPVIYLLNIDQKAKFDPPPVKYLEINLKDEAEMVDLSESEIRELGLKSQLDQLILACYNILDLITFYTVAGGKETRAWTVKKGSLAPQAGGKVHTDFEEKFIRAEVISWEKLVEAGSWQKARELGWIKTVGKDYQLKDGEVIEFKI
jgi:hypothetical protein